MGRLTFSTRITLVRIVLVPLLVALILADGDVRHAPALAAVVFLLASFTDFVDGYLARRWQQVTSLGNFLDTTADKLLVIGALVALEAIGVVNIWVVFVIITREVVVLGLRAVAASSSVVISASIWGKLKFNAQVVGITLAILHPDILIGSLRLDEWAMLAVAAISALSAVDYHVAGKNQLCLPDPTPLYRVNVDGTARLLRAAQRAGVRRVVYTSSAATLGGDGSRA